MLETGNLVPKYISIGIRASLILIMSTFIFITKKLRYFDKIANFIHSNNKKPVLELCLVLPSVFLRSKVSIDENV